MFNNEWHARVIGFIVGILMIAIYCWMISGVVSILINLYHFLLEDWSHGAEKMIKEVLIIFALLEFIRVLQSYLLLGRVRVTFILDVALVVLIGELIGFWYHEFNAVNVILGIIIIAVLTGLRIITSKCSPDFRED